MSIKIPPFLAGLFLATCCAVTVPPIQAENDGGLDARQEAIVPIAAFAASGDLEELKQALNEGLEAGLTVNEIRKSWSNCMPMQDFPAA